MTDIPLTFEHNHLVTDARINGSAARMIVDTGSFGTVLATEGAARLKLAAPGTLGGEAHGIGGRRAFSMLHPTSLQIGKLGGQDLYFDVFRNPGILGNQPVDGLLGMDMLGQFDIDLDLPEKRIILYKPVSGCSQPSAALESPLYDLPMVQSLYERRALVPVTIGGKHMTALLDSGARSTVIFKSAASRLGFSEASGSKGTTIGGIGASQVHAWKQIVPSLTAGALTISNMPAFVSSDDSPDESDMILGLDFFERVHLWMSFSSRTVLMQFPPKPSPAAP